MQAIKYFVSKITFRKEKFADMLIHRMNVPAAVVEDGIILDLEAFNAVEPAHMPHWAYINREYINSGLHTRPATTWETKLLRSTLQYHLIAIYKTENVKIAESDKIAGLKVKADMMLDAEKLVIVDTYTGEAVYTVGL